MAKVMAQPASDQLYGTLLASALDGRGRNARYRQSQLYFLHTFLRTNADKIRSAIHQDTASPDDVETEYSLALDTVRRLYDQINFGDSIKDEFRIAKNLDNGEARVPYGVVVIRPTVHTRFFSIISATATAFAAGNVVLLELESSSRSVDAFFRSEFRTFDNEAFIISTSRVDDAGFLHKCLVVDQTKSEVDGPDCLRHDPERQTIAVVDRTADVAMAARAIVRSKRRYGGTSPYGVDVVLVNEWAKQEFMATCAEAVNECTATCNVSGEHTGVETATTAQPAEDHLLNAAGFIISESPRGSTALRKKTGRHKVNLVTVSGLVDATAVASSLGPPLALYCFSNPHEAKHLGQHIDSGVCLVNQIPSCLLVGPSIPEFAIFPDLHLRYDTTMMSKAAPQLISNVDSRLDLICKQQTIPLKPIKQHSGFDVGFFDRGAIVGAFTIVLPTICLSVYGGWQAAIYGYHRLTKSF